MYRASFLPAMIACLTLALAPVMSALAADERQSLEELRNTVINLLQALVDQGVITREKADQMVKAAQAKAAADAAALAKEDEGAVRVPYVPQIVKDEIAKQVAEEVKPQVVAGVVDQAKTEGWGVPGALADWLKRTRLSADVTLREEGLFYDKNNTPQPNYYAINQAGGPLAAGQNAVLDSTETRIRFRGRLHFAVDSDVTDSITAGFRLATGNTTDLVSETQTIDGTAPYTIGIDELYIRDDERNAQRFPWLSVVVGRYLNPYDSPTDLIFHKDLTFEGLAATGRFGLGDGSAQQSHIFLTLGGHPLQEVEFSAQDKWLVGGQLGSYLRLTDAQNVRFAAAFYDYFNVTGRLNPPDSTIYDYTAPQFMRLGNTVFNIENNGNPESQLWAYASKFRLLNLNATYTVSVGRYNAIASVDAVRNFGFNAAQVEANTGYYVAPRTKGYQGQVSFGYPAVLTPGSWRALVGYRYLQRDAVIDEYTDSDFHYFGGTNAQGYYLIIDYGVANRVWLRLRYLSANDIDPTPFAVTTGVLNNKTDTFGVDTLQFDVNTRF
ncbi:MAG TPA: putative porin [Steroidobacteraceae bacterium]|nr:putative porin [Steroidobacteraceae bacterium]